MKNALIEAMVRTDEPSDIGDPDVAAIMTALEHLHSRFVDERTNGFSHPVTGQPVEPVSREAAEQRWEAAKSKFAHVLLKASPSDPMQKRMRMSKGALPARSTYSEKTPEFEAPETDWSAYEKEWQSTPADRAARDEPSLRRGESRAARAVKQMIQT